MRSSAGIHESGVNLEVIVQTVLGLLIYLGFIATSLARLA